MPDSSGSIAAMLATFLHLLAQTPVEQAQEKTAAEEGRDIVLMMLLVGVIFVGFALLADLWNWRSAQAPQRASLDRRRATGS
jgi:heme/copper-type cytochrome/quinol oxidase subunit 2